MLEVKSLKGPNQVAISTKTNFIYGRNGSNPTRESSLCLWQQQRMRREVCERPGLAAWPRLLVRPVEECFTMSE